MIRLTEKQVILKYTDIINVNGNAIDKLGSLEDIEEELGIELFKTLIKVKRSDLLILNMKGNYENDK